MKKIVVAGYYGYQNSGDDAILHSICNDIQKLDVETAITVLSNQPKVTKREYEVSSINRFNFREVMDAVKHTDVLVMGGGSLIQDLTSTRSLFYYLGLIWMAKLRRKKVMLYGNGIGPIRKWYNKPLVKWTLNQVEMITLREHESKEILSAIGVVKPIVEITADPVFNLQLENDFESREIYELERIPDDKPLVGVLFRSWSHEDSYTRKMAKVCDEIIESYDYNIVFVPMKHPADLIVAFEIMKRMKHKAYVIEHRYHEKVLIQFLGTLDLLLSMRLHGLIYGALKQVPVIGFNYDPKVEYYAKELDIPFVEDMRHIHVEKIMDMIQEIRENREVIIEKMRLRVDELKQEAARNREYLEKLLKG